MKKIFIRLLPESNIFKDPIVVERWTGYYWTKILISQDDFIYNVKEVKNVNN